MPSPHYLFLIVLAVVIIGGIFLFNLDDKVFGSIKQEKIKELESFNINEDFNTDLQVQKNGIEGKIEDNPSSKITNEQLVEYHSQKEKEQNIKEEFTDSVSILEKKKFHLEGVGDVWVDSKSSTTPIKISAILIPVKGMELTKFGLVDCQIIIGDKIFNFNKGSVEITKSKLTLSIIPAIENSIFFLMTGSYDSKIKNFNYNGKVMFDNESFYIYSPEKKLYHISYEATISSIQNK